MPSIAFSAPAAITFALRMGALLASLLALPGLRAVSVDVGGRYDAEGTVVMAQPAYDGPVSLRALLALDFDHARGVKAHGGVTAFEITQEERKLRIQTRTAEGRVEWTGEWTRNGGFEATESGVKFLIRAQRLADGMFLFTLNPASDGAALTVRIQRVENSLTGAVGHDVGTFIFLRDAK